MSNRRRLKLRPMPLPYRVGATDVELDQAEPGDRCEYHPGCCGPEDTTCQGCGAEAVGALTFRRDHEAHPARRTPFCASHERSIAEGLRAVQLRMQGAVGSN